MTDFFKKKRNRRILYSRFTLIILLVVVLFMGKAVWGMYTKQVETREEKERLSEDLYELEVRKEDLVAKLDKIETERGIEEEVRDTYGVAKPGEEVIVIVDEEDEQGEVEDQSRRSIWQKFLDIFR